MCIYIYIYYFACIFLRVSVRAYESHRNRFLHVLLVKQCVIDAEDDPVEQGAVQRFGHGVPGCDSLMREGVEDMNREKNLA